jgi:hypothetical protein
MGAGYVSFCHNYSIRILGNHSLALIHVGCFRFERADYNDVGIDAFANGSSFSVRQSMSAEAKIRDDILSYREMCDAEEIQTLQRGMNFRMRPAYSVILMSQRTNAPYHDRVHDDGITIEYEGHDVSRRSHEHNPKSEDQPDKLPTGRLTQNGLFVRAVEAYKEHTSPPELAKVYEKILPGVWSLKGYFDLVDYKIVHDGKRNVFRFILRLSDRGDVVHSNEPTLSTSHTRLIPSEVKKEVWKRDNGRCVICGDAKNLHFDHDLPFSKGGTSISAKNVRLLCMKHNLEKSGKIE